MKQPEQLTQLKHNILKRPKLTKKSVLEFGKYKGYKIKTVLERDPQYVVWLIEHTQTKVTGKVRAQAYAGAITRRATRSNLYRSTNNSYNGDDWDDLSDYGYDQYMNGNLPGPGFGY